MADHPDDSYVDLRVPLENLFAMVEARLDEVRGDPSQERQPYDGVLDVVDKYVKGPLMAEAANAGGATLAALHLAHLARMVVGEGIQEQGSGSGRYRNLKAARLELDSALTAVSERHDADVRDRLGELEVLTQQQPQLVADAVESALAKQGCPCAAELHKLDGDVNGLPQAISASLISDIPQILSGVIAVIKGLSNGTQQQPPPPVIKPVHFRELKDLAAASAADHTHSPGDQINFLAGALQVLEDKGPVPADLRGPIITVIAGVLYFHDPTAPPLTGPELNDITDLKQQITPFLQ